MFFWTSVRPVSFRASIHRRTDALSAWNFLQIAQVHATGLTPNLLKLFEPRPQLEFKPVPQKRKLPPITGDFNAVLLLPYVTSEPVTVAGWDDRKVSIIIV